jgi:glycerol-3-phosphate dehydrogenase subunit B
VTALVIGGGFAGVAAAWALESRGREVFLVWEGAGASALYSGALDRDDWHGSADGRAVPRDVEDFLHALGCWAPPGLVSARLATSAGILRPARCRDRALLDLEPLRGRRIDVLDLGRGGWDAQTLAHAWSSTHWARQSRTEFRAVAPSVPAGGALGGPDALRFLPDLELAARADDASWAGAFGELLSRAGDGDAPLLLGPWLGLVPTSLERIREVARRPIGETLSEPGGAAGARFEAARELWLGRSRVRAVRGQVESIAASAAGFVVTGQGGADANLLECHFAEVILALGGVAGGGIRFLWDLASSNGTPAGVAVLAGPDARSFSLSLRAPLPLRLDGREVALESGVLGADLQSLGRDALERVGIAVDDEQQSGLPGLLAAGDVVADRPRTALEAMAAGISAARSACRVRRASGL